MKPGELYKEVLIIIGILAIVLFNNCAKIGSPTGGPKDTIPPEIIVTKPENRSIYFDDDRIEIEFDEFIQLKDINKELVVSPPLDEKPLVRLRNKSMIIDLEGELLDSTTYTLNFGQAIADNNEGNLLSDYQFVFSTGSYIDSLGIAGVLLNAFDLKASEDPVLIMLYDDHKDSLPYTDIPLYVGKTSKDGSFFINNLRPDTFKVFALKDGNANFLYDLPDEAIAFLDTTVILTPEHIKRIVDSAISSMDTMQLADSAWIDTLPVAVPDTIITENEDTIVMIPAYPLLISIELYLFQENNIQQYLLDYKRPDPRRLEFYFNRPLTDTMIIEPLNFKPEENWLIFEQHVVGDTLIYWIRDSVYYKMDTLELHLTYDVTDSILNLIPYHDTVKMIFTESQIRRKKSKEEEIKAEALDLLVSIKSGATQDLNRGIEIISAHPVSNIDWSRISLYMKEDTIESKKQYEMLKDSISIRTWWLNAGWEERMNYRLFLEPDAFMDIYGLTNDTINVPFKIQSLDHYGKIFLNLEVVQGQLVIQLLGQKDAVIREEYVNTDSRIEFSFLEPGNYRIKAIFDRNGNRKWDTGKYLDKNQPEKVGFYKGEINVRANWDLDINWNLNE